MRGMKYEGIQAKNDVEFRRLTGLKRETFKAAVKILLEAEAKKKVFGGRPPSHSMEDRLLMACGYWREYRTYEHIAATFDTTKSTVQRIILWIEDTLIKSGKFSLPGKKALRKAETEYEIILIDATESPICRPTKTKKAIILAKRSDTH